VWDSSVPGMTPSTGSKNGDLSDLMHFETLARPFGTLQGPVADAVLYETAGMLSKLETVTRLTGPGWYEQPGGVVEVAVLRLGAFAWKQ
jgi:hypothetical protein